MPTIIGAGDPTSGYEVENSLRFNNNDTAYLNRTRSSQSNTTGTFSVWTKMAVPSDDNVLFGGHTDVNNRGYIYFSDPDGYVGIFSRTSGSADINYASNGRFRDPTAWYHVVVAIDTTQGTAGNRFKMYINGTQYTDWGTASAPSQNASLPILNKAAQTVGGGYGSSSVSSMADSYLADFYYIDGQQLDASNFGETNDNGVWIPKRYLGTYGTNGFKLEFQQTGTGTASASTIGADTSGNDNHLTSNNLAATDVTTDTPTNNFCTLNPLDNHFQAATFAEGNTKITTNASNYSASSSTIGVANGKWYFEAKATDVHDSLIGASGQTETSSTNGLGQNANQVGYLSSGNARKGGSDTSTGYDSYTDGDIIGVALDIDNSKIYFSKNGTYQASGDPANNSNGFALTAVASTSTGFYTPSVGDNGSSAAIWEMNFGNAPFSISSGNADANGYGNFEYAPPSGYYALCTKNLARYG
jgi:hypothetical protein